MRFQKKTTAPPPTVLEVPRAAMQIEMWPTSRPVPYPKNARKWSERAIATVASSIREYGFRQPIVVDAKDVIVIGHLRLAAAKSMDLAEVPVHVASDLSAAQIKGLRIADNRTAIEASWDLDLLGPELLDLKSLDFDLGLTGFDDAEITKLLGATGADPLLGGAGSLSERFGVPPFSVLDARQGYWQERKRAWLALGIQSELGRGGAPGGSPRPAAQLTANGHTARGDGIGRAL